MERHLFNAEKESQAEREKQQRLDLTVIKSTSKYLLENQPGKKRFLNRFRNRHRNKLIVDSDKNALLKGALDTIQSSIKYRPRIIISTEIGKLGNENYDLMDIDYGFVDENGKTNKELSMSFTSSDINSRTVTISQKQFHGNFAAFANLSPAEHNRIPQLISVMRLIDTKLHRPEVAENNALLRPNAE